MTKGNIWKSLTLSACILVGSVLPAAALEKEDFNFHTTEDLYSLCSVPQSHGEDYVAASYACRGFLEATVQYHDGVSDRKNLKRLVCYPKGTTLAEGKAAFIAWVEKNKKNTELMNELPVIGLVRSLADKYPCPK